MHFLVCIHIKPVSTFKAKGVNSNLERKQAPKKRREKTKRIRFAIGVREYSNKIVCRIDVSHFRDLL